jgi:REP element-mobilizing transposase RayT
MTRALKRGVQQRMASLLRALDKNGQLRGALKGERRKGVGRPKLGFRASERHKVRAEVKAYEPQHVILRADRSVGSLRRGLVLFAIREALITLAKRADSFRVVQFSLQSTHLHLIVEASDREALIRGMQAFSISAAKHINAQLVDEHGRRRRGSVFPDRYYSKRLGSPRQVRNCLAYVMNNWRHHDEDRGRSWLLDPFSSAVAFQGWKERASAPGERYLQPSRYVSPLVWEPKTWLLTTGWRKHGLISVYERPGGDDE